MKISKSSFQYKMVKWMFTPSRDLCIYFWQCVCAWCMATAVIAMIIGFFVLPYVLAVYPDPSQAPVIMQVLYFFGIFPWSLLVVIPLGYCCHRIISVFDNTNPNVVGEYIKAKKDNVCPRIDFED